MASANPDLKYDFMPWARRGLARAHTHAQLNMDGVSALPGVTLGLKLKGTGGSEMSATPTVDLKLLGPGDVIGIDPRIIVRVEPRSNNHDFEPNYLAAIEFDFAAALAGPDCVFGKFLQIGYSSSLTTFEPNGAIGIGRTPL